MKQFIFYELFPTICSMSVTAGIVILFVLLARLLLKRAPKIFSYALWAVVLFRLLCPVSIPAGFALLGLFNAPVKEALKPRASIAAYVWLAGILVMLSRGAVSSFLLRRRLVGATPLRGNIYHADHIASPFVMGLLRPKIYIPSALSEKEQAYIILHEQCHVRRLDHVSKALAFAALCIHWFNPLVWVAFVLSGKDMEMSCDESVIKKLGAAIRADYSASLLSLATGRRIIAGMPLAFGEGDTKGRIKNLLRWRKPRLWVTVAASVICVAVIAACAANPAAPAQSDETERKDESELIAFNETLQNLPDEANAAHEAVKLYDGDYEEYFVRNENPRFNVEDYALPLLRISILRSQ